MLANATNTAAAPILTLEDKLNLRLESLRSTPKRVSLNDEASREWIAKNLSMIGVPAKLLDVCVEILEYMSDMKVVWLHLQECTGCSESLLRTDQPSFDVLMLEMFKIHYHDLVLMASGYGAEKILETIGSEKFVLLVEGSVSMGEQEEYITLGGKSGYKEVSHLIEHAQAVFAVGTCSSYGGIQTAHPNPTNGFGLKEVFDKEIIHIPGCPPSDRNIIGNLMYFYLLGEAPALDELGRPLWAYAKSVHDLCERRNFFLSGDFAQSFDDPNMAEGYCLYKVGCKGPYTFNNCPKVKFNSKTSWPVQAGHGCIGCSEPNFWDNFGLIERPLGNENFTTFNSRFLSMLDVSALQRLDMRLDEASLASLAQEKSSKYTLIDLSIGKDAAVYFAGVDSSLDSGEADSGTNADSGAVVKNSIAPLEINPRAVLDALESKSKQTKRLYENYAKELKSALESIKSLDAESLQSSDIYAFLGCWYALLEGASEIASKATLEAMQKLGSNMIARASEFAYPYQSPLGFKLKQSAQTITLDTTKALSNMLAYRVGGLDAYGACFSVVHDLGEAIGEYLAKNAADCAIVLQGELAQNEVFLRGVLKGQGIARASDEVKARIFVSA